MHNTYPGDNGTTYNGGGNDSWGAPPAWNTPTNVTPVPGPDSSDPWAIPLDGAPSYSGYPDTAFPATTPWDTPAGAPQPTGDFLAPDSSDPWAVPLAPLPPTEAPSYGSYPQPPQASRSPGYYPPADTYGGYPPQSQMPPPAGYPAYDSYPPQQAMPSPNRGRNLRGKIAEVTRINPELAEAMGGTLRAAGDAALRGAGVRNTDGKFSWKGAAMAGFDWKSAAIGAGQAIIGDAGVRGGVQQMVGAVTKNNPRVARGVETARVLSRNPLVRDAMGRVASRTASRFAMSGGY